MANLPALPLKKTSIENAVPHKLYDLSIEDLTERREKAMEFRSAAAAANYLGVVPKYIYGARHAGRRIYSKKFSRWYAIRVIAGN